MIRANFKSPEFAGHVHCLALALMEDAGRLGSVSSMVHYSNLAREKLRTMTKEQLIERLQQELESLEISYPDAAKKAEKSSAHFYRVMNGEYEPTFDWIVDVYDRVLGIQLEIVEID